MNKIMQNDIKIEYAEFVNRLMIDAQLSSADIKIGLCLLYELLLVIKKNSNPENKCN